ncbi:hypothetical protein [Calothrix sp. 336/3]|uniref:hypothetical protein n=1 Tax=Calothrix sp. 336/3 TaxID=1337936 RepID=UPI000624C9AA|nr:hypothetical protein [Calothrix sp. 336/3]AKG24420.1 hypothetical protein IJ00_03665 [Calothrix sp. 336/3]
MISILELIEILNQNHQHILINLQALQANYHRIALKRHTKVDNLQTEYIDKSDYVNIVGFVISQKKANINLLIKRRIQLIEGGNQKLDIAGLLINDLHSYNSYTIIADGLVHIKFLKIKISSQQVFAQLKQRRIITGDTFDFRREYTINLERFPLLPENYPYPRLSGVFLPLAEMKIMASILAAHLKQESDVFVKEQLADLGNYHLSKNLYLNLPKAIDTSSGKIDSHLSYVVDIGNSQILNLNKIPSANQFLARYYLAENQYGEIISPTKFALTWDDNIYFQPKPSSPRRKFTAIDGIMKPIFDDFLGLSNQGIIARILTSVGADSLLHLLTAKHSGKTLNHWELVSAMTFAHAQLQKEIQNIYRRKISPLVLYLRSQGKLPEGMNCQEMDAQSLQAQYPDLQISNDEKLGYFYLVDDTIISVYPQISFYQIDDRSNHQEMQQIAS